MHIRKFALSALAASLIAFAPIAAIGAPQAYRIDTVHSGITFRIGHFFNQVPGTFSKFSGSITYDAENLAQSRASAVIEVASIHTRSDRRDNHLRTDDFFNASQFPKITFESTRWERVGEGRYRITGNLTMLEVTKPVTLDAKLLGVGPGREGRLTSGWSATTTLDRRDWGITYGQGVIGNQVEIQLDVQGHGVD